MKNKLFLVLAFVALFSASFAQNKNSEGADKKWTIGIDGGINHAHQMRGTGLYSLGLNVNYNFTEFFGLSLVGGMGNFDYDAAVPAFDIDYKSIALEGTFNLTRLFYLDDLLSEKFSVEGLVGATAISHDVRFSSSEDREVAFSQGMKVTYWLGNTVGITLTGKNHLPLFRQHVEFNGFRRNGLGDHFQEIKVGLAFALGKNEKSIMRRSGSYRAGDPAPDMSPYATKEQLNALAEQSDITALNERAKKLEDRIAALEKQPAQAASSSNVNPSDFISGIFFPLGSAVAYKDADHAVIQIFNYLNSNPNAKVSLTGYADATGSESFNKKLSEKRAKYVANLLTGMGISSSRVSYTGAGVSSTIKTNKYNRRVDVAFK